MDSKTEIKWLAAPEEQDYPAALSYLSLIYNSQSATRYVQQLKQEPMTAFKAKDIFRASQLSLLGVSNSHVEKNRKKFIKGNRFRLCYWLGTRLPGKLSSRMATIGCARYMGLMRMP